jgi:hypothetical protein
MSYACQGEIPDPVKFSHSRWLSVLSLQGIPVLPLQGAAPGKISASGDLSIDGSGVRIDRVSWQAVFDSPAFRD